MQESVFFCGGVSEVGGAWCRDFCDQIITGREKKLARSVGERKANTVQRKRDVLPQQRLLGAPERSPSIKLCRRHRPGAGFSCAPYGPAAVCKGCRCCSKLAPSPSPAPPPPSGGGPRRHGVRSSFAAPSASSTASIAVLRDVCLGCPPGSRDGQKRRTPFVVALLSSRPARGREAPDHGKKPSSFRCVPGGGGLPALAQRRRSPVPPMPPPGWRVRGGVLPALGPNGQCFVFAAVAVPTVPTVPTPTPPPWRSAPS